MVQKPDNTENLRELVTAQTEELEDYKVELATLRAQINVREDAGEIIESEEEVLYDPFDSQNSLIIIGEIESEGPDSDFPEGQVLGFKNPTWRDQSDIGWKGWIPLQYGDKYTGKDGELLSRYLASPPRKEGVAVKGQEYLDGYVRCMDLLLCRLDKRIWKTRSRMRERRALRAKRDAEVRANLTFREGVHMVGSGLLDEARPAGGFRMERKRPSTEPGRTELFPHNRPDPQE